MDSIVNIITQNPILIILIIVMLIMIFRSFSKENNKPKSNSSTHEADQTAKNDFIDEEELIAQESQSTKFPYYLEKSLLTSKEKLFYQGLKPVTDKRNLIILSKIRLADIFKVPQNTYNSIKWFNYIKAKHADFVICTQEFEPIMIIEIDDKTHNRTDRKERDKFVNEVCRQAGIKIVHIWTWNGTEGIEQLLFPQEKIQQQKNPSFSDDSAG